MAKQRRDHSDPTKPQSKKPVARRPPVAPPRPAEIVDEAAIRRRAAFQEAVALYDRGMQAFQQREYRRAAELLSAVLEQHPEELDLRERARLYLKICERQASPVESTPRTLQERIYAATLALNAGAPHQALPHLRAALEADPQNDHALYMLAVVHTLRSDPAAALIHLQQSIALNPENRARARQDPDLDALRLHPDARALLDTPAGPDRRRFPRSRPAH